MLSLQSLSKCSYRTKLHSVLFLLVLVFVRGFEHFDNLSIFKNAVACLLSKQVLSARAGIRTRVGGMKTHYDGPGYTTRATAVPPTTP